MIKREAVPSIIRFGDSNHILGIESGVFVRIVCALNHQYETSQWTAVKTNRSVYGFFGTASLYPCALVDRFDFLPVKTLSVRKRSVARIRYDSSRAATTKAAIRLTFRSRPSSRVFTVIIIIIISFRPRENRITILSSLFISGDGIVFPNVIAW